MPCSKCEAPIEAQVIDSLNAERHPHLRALVLEGRLHLYVCGACGACVVVDKELTYVDFGRRQLLGVFPLSELWRARACAEQIAAAYERWVCTHAPAFIRALAPAFLVRVCFGYDELREKLVADDAGLSDLALEVLKSQVLAAEPGFAITEVLTLRLERITPESLVFYPQWAWPVDTEPPRVHVQRRLYDEVAAAPEAELLARYPGLASGPHVSLLRLGEWPAPAER